MPTIVEEYFCNGAEQKIARLGLTNLLDDLRLIIRGFDLRVEERKDANGGAAVRKLIDGRFRVAGGWTLGGPGVVDWMKSQTANGIRVCLGVEVQMSARSDLLVIDLIHLRKEITEGRIDVGVVVVPSDRLGRFLTDRGPKMSDAKRHVIAARVEDLPLVLIAIEHDGPGPALAKQYKRTVE